MISLYPLSDRCTQYCYRYSDKFDFEHCGSGGWIETEKYVGKGEAGRTISNAGGTLAVGETEGGAGSIGVTTILHLDSSEAALPCISGTCRVTHDNFHVQHEIPQNDIQYAWITASAITTPCDLGGHQKLGAHTNRGGAFTDITFVSSSEVSGNSIDVIDHLNITGFNKELRYIDPFRNTLDKDRAVYTIDGQAYTFGGAGTPTNAIDLGGSTTWNNIIGTEGTGKHSFAIWFNITEFTAGGDSSPRLFDFSQEVLFFLKSGSEDGYPRIDLGYQRGYTGTNLDYRTVGTKQPGINFNNWHFAVATLNENNFGEPPKIYVDGVKVPLAVVSDPAGALEPIATFNNCFVGGVRAGSDAHRQLSGSVAEFSVWKEELTEKEVEILFETTRPPDQSGPPRSYREHEIDKQIPAMRGKLVSWW